MRYTAHPTVVKRKKPNSAQEAIHRIVTILSHQPKTAGAFVASHLDETEAMYSIGQKLGGKARKQQSRHKGTLLETTRFHPIGFEGTRDATFAVMII